MRLLNVPYDNIEKISPNKETTLTIALLRIIITITIDLDLIEQ